MILRNWFIPAGDAQQLVRMRRFLLALATYAVCVPLLLVARWLGLIEPGPLPWLLAVVVAINAVLYTLLRSGINRHFADPSLTRAQTFAAIIVLMGMVYAMDRERSLALILLPVLLMFGSFRFSTRDFFAAAGFALAGYAIVIGLLLWFKPQTVDPLVELFRWTLLACVLPCFSLVAGRLSELRQNLRRANGDLESALARIQQLATHDSLTGMPNRALLNENLLNAVGRARRHGRSVAVLFVDLDQFKIVNDTLGHAVGDRVLQESARRLGACIRDGDMAGRLGGDEFVVVVEEFVDRKVLIEITERVLAAIRQPLAIDGREIYLTASIGVSTFPADAQDSQALLSNADIAMYRAKESGRNCVRFYQVRARAVAVDRLNVEAGLRQALHRDEFSAHYQPKINLATGAVTGVEVLLRWRHPDLGLLYPERFIAIAEASGLIVPMGLWTLRRACSEARAWQRRGLEIPIAVNISARQFHHARLTDDLGDILRETGLPPEFLEVEITESMTMIDPDRSLELLNALHEMGVRISLDDFGTGYSSLARLKRFPIDALKLDRAFVKELPEDRDDVAITRAVIAMAHAMQIRVIAEGVESIAQLHLLRQEGCDEFQGYLCRPALSEPDFIAFMQNDCARSRWTAFDTLANDHAAVVAQGGSQVAPALPADKPSVLIGPRRVRRLA